MKKCALIMNRSDLLKRASSSGTGIPINVKRLVASSHVIYHTQLIVLFINNIYLNSRLSILPTLVLGNSSLNSMSLGTL
jgi:hypothetical protein